MRQVCRIIAILLWATIAAAQTDRMPSGTSLPAKCTRGDQFDLTTAVTGRKIYLCISTNVWEQQGIGGTVTGLNITVNGTPTTDQTQLQFINGTNTTVSNPSSGQIRIDAPSAPGVTFQSNGTNLSNQTTINYQNGNGTTVTNPNVGNVKIDGASIQVNGTPVSNQSVVNFVNGTNTTVTNPSAGQISIAASGGGGGGGNVSSASPQTVNTLAKWSSTNIITNSSISDNGQGTVSVGSTPFTGTLGAARINGPLVTPGSLNNGDWWVECAGTTPSRQCTINVRDGGVTYSQNLGAAH